MRKITTISDGWRFLKADLPIEQAVAYAERGEAVWLPHTWNAIDGQDGGNDYHRGRCWYVRKIEPEELLGEANFLEIMYGPQAIGQMRSLKRALDPAGMLNPGNLFPSES